jgi:hypothetical protein
MPLRASSWFLSCSLVVSLACDLGAGSAPVPPPPATVLPPPPVAQLPPPTLPPPAAPPIGVAPSAAPGPVAAATAPLTHAPLLDAGTRVVIAGLLEFSDPGLSGFSKADRRDVELGRVLVERGVPVAHTTTLLDQQATRAAILAALTAAADATPPGGTLVFYYAGHGIRTESGQIAYVAYDTHSEHPDRPGVSVDDLHAVLAPRMAGKRVVFFGDCCHSGGLGALAGRLGTAGATALSVTSADASNLSTGNWTYSQILLEGLRGDPALDANGDARVAMGELEAGVRVAMRYLEGQRSGAFLGGVDRDALTVAPRVGPPRAGVEAGQFMHDSRGNVVRVNRVDGPAASVRRYAYALSSDSEVPLARLAPIVTRGYAVGTELMVEWGGRVWPARVTAADGDFAFITYPGWPNYWDEWILSDRVRSVTAVAENPPIR